MKRGIGAIGVAEARVAPSLSMRAESAAPISEIDPLVDSRWEGFINGHPQASVFHSTKWLRALQIAYGYDPVVLTSSSDENALTNGLVFCRVKSWLTGKRLVSVPFADHCEPLAHHIEELDVLLLHAKRAVEAGEWKYVEIRPVSYQPADRTGLHRSITYQIHNLDLNKSKEALFHSFHKSCVQNKVRRAEREQLRYEEGRSAALISKFYDLLVATRRRQYLPPQPRAWFHTLIETFGDSLKIRVASKGVSPIAAILTLSHKKSMYYKYGCSDVRFHKFGGMAFLFWNAIQDAKEKGLEEFNLGRSDLDNLGLIGFKEHWGAIGKPLVYWTYPQRPEATQSTWEKAMLRQLVPITPDYVLKKAGQLLYRHIG